MRDKQSGKHKQKTRSRAAVRASISFPPGLYKSLESIAQQKRVSLAWVVRDAAEIYITNNVPTKEHQPS